jgi:hypothetical protein
MIGINKICLYSVLILFTAFPVPVVLFDLVVYNCCLLIECFIKMLIIYAYMVRIIIYLMY